MCRRIFSPVILALFLSLTAIQPAFSSQPLDLNSFTEADPPNKIMITTDCAAFTNIETRTTNAHVYKSYPVSGDFSFTFDTVLTSTDTFSGETAMWGISNTADATFEDWGNGIILGYYSTGSTPKLKLGNFSYDSSVNLSLGTRYYLRVFRSGTTVTAQIYSDAGRTNLVDTLTRNFDANTYNYLYAFSARSYIGTNKKASGDTCHFVDENAGPPSVPSAPYLNLPSAGDTTVDLSWNAVSGAEGYNVKYGLSSGSHPSVFNVGNVTSHQVTDLINGTTYYFVVTASNGGGASPNSNEEPSTPVAPPALSPIIENVDYNASGQIIRIEFGNGMITDYTYNPLNLRLMRIRTTNPEA